MKLSKSVNALLMCLALACAAPARADDHGDSIATATALSLGSTNSTSVAGAINTAGDNDYFRVQVLGIGLLTVRTQGATDTYGYLLNSSGAPLIVNDDSIDMNFRYSYVVTTGTYYIRVRHYNVGKTGNYTLLVDCSACNIPIPPDDHAGNMAKASAVAPASSTAGNIERAGDEDYFKITVPSSGALVLKSTGVTDTYGHLLNAGGTQLDSSDDDSDRNFRIVSPVMAGTYYLRVHHYNVKGTGAYALVSTFSPGAAFAPGTDSFVAAKASVCTDLDSANGCQSVDLAWSFIQDVLGVPRSAHDIRGNAYAIYSAVSGSKTIASGTRRVRLDKIAYTASAVPQKGDIIFWRPAASNGNTGHVGIFVSGNASSFVSLDQNWSNYSGTRGSAAARITHNYSNVVGWLRPVLLAN